MIKKVHLVLVLISLLVAFIYYDSWNSRFFQDDKIHFRIISENANFLTPPADWPYYRPVAINLFYSFGKAVSGTNPFGYHLILFLAFAATLFCFFALAKTFLENNRRALLATLFYATNVSLFGDFYWIAKSYLVLGSLFMFLSVLAYQKKSRWWFIVSAMSVTLALGSNELGFVLPGLFILTDWLRKRWPGVRFIILTGLTFFLGVWRYFLVGVPKDSDYTIHLGLVNLSTVKWYLFRLINLPEAVQRDKDAILWVGISIFLIAMLYFVVRYKNRRKNWRLFIFGVLWFFGGAAPHFLMPEHISSQYLAVSLFGPAIILGEIAILNLSVVILFAGYLLATWRGLDFLRLTHWLILKNTGPIGKF